MTTDLQHMLPELNAPLGLPRWHDQAEPVEAVLHQHASPVAQALRSHSYIH